MKSSRAIHVMDKDQNEDDVVIEDGEQKKMGKSGHSSSVFVNQSVKASVGARSPFRELEGRGLQRGRDKQGGERSNRSGSIGLHTHGHSTRRDLTTMKSTASARDQDGDDEPLYSVDPQVAARVPALNTTQGLCLHQPSQSVNLPPI